MSTPPLIDVRDIVARTLGLPVEEVHPSLAYRDVPEWDSLGHVGIIVALERALGEPIDDVLARRLLSVEAIERYVSKLAPIPPPGSPAVARGLEGIVLDSTKISDIDGQHGKLLYRGYRVEDLAAAATFEEVTFLLVEGRLPDPTDRPALEHAFHIGWKLGSSGSRKTPGVPTLVALRTAVSGLEPVPPQEHRLLVFVAAIGGLLAGSPPGGSPSKGTSYARRLLSSLTHRDPAGHEVRAFEAALVLHAEHGANASTLSARVAAGAGASAEAAVVAALAVFSGDLHGGAGHAVLRAAEAIGHPGRAAEYVRETLSNRQPVYGFGHRLYRVEDPRATILRQLVSDLVSTPEDRRTFETLRAIEAAMAERRRHGVAANVDLYNGLLYRVLGCKDDVGTAVFAAARAAGWVAHVVEQYTRRTLIRPELTYAGEPWRPLPKSFGGRLQGLRDWNCADQ